MSHLRVYLPASINTRRKSPQFSPGESWCQNPESLSPAQWPWTTFVLTVPQFASLWHECDNTTDFSCCEQWCFAICTTPRECQH